MKTLVLAVLALATQSPDSAAVPQADSAARVRQVAHAAEIRYERLVRRLAPFRLGGFGTGCDEIVGRYCVRYDSPRDEPPALGPEPAQLTDARRAAIEALRGAFSYLPGEFETAGPLVRYLVEDGRPAEALPAARLYRAVSTDSVWGPLLVGFALHALGDASRAQLAFDQALDRMPPAERQRIEDLGWLLEADDRRAYDDMDADGRRGFEALFWLLTDPLLMIPGNEARTEHLARHVWSRILERTPVVAGAQSWGSDLEQLTVRFGTPSRRTRVTGPYAADEAIVDHFDPRQLAYAPRALLTEGLPPTPLPGQPWELARKRNRAGYSARTVNAVRYLHHQVSRFPDPGGTRIRFDGAFADSLPATRGSIEAGLWLLDPGGKTVAEAADVVLHQADTVGFDFEVAARPGAWIYSLEAIEQGDSAAARARYSIDVEPAPAGPRISDPVIIRPFREHSRPESRGDPGFAPFASLTFTVEDTIAVYVEAAGLRPGGAAGLRLSLQKASRANVPARVLGWIGRKIGLVGARDPVFVEWTSAADAEGRLVLAFELPPQDIDDGDHILVASLTDLATSTSTESRRVIRYVKPAS